MANSLTTELGGVGRFILSSGHAPATAAPSVLSRAIGTVLARSEQRRALRELADRGDAHLLRDIGLTRQAAWREGAKWFWQR
jgi:uncharacterized protein YjiS (DUF1127 family)